MRFPLLCLSLFSKKKLNPLAVKLGLLGCMTLTSHFASAEGSKNFIDYPGYRMFLDTRDSQQMKVYAAEGEFINIGSSHLGIHNGFISVFNPDGVLVQTFNGSNGIGVIYNRAQEIKGPIGGPVGDTLGYTPGVIQVPQGQGGIWTVYFGFPLYSPADFPNILNAANWTRSANQPNIPRVVLAWDITVSQNQPGDQGGLLKSGRVYTNEYITVINDNGYNTSPIFHILTKGGFIFEVKFHDADPFRFPISSNSSGLVYSNLQPTYTSQPKNMVNRSLNPASWVPDMYYLYEPQAQDYDNGAIINNKIFFTFPDTLMPFEAKTTDVFRNNTHFTWLYKKPADLSVAVTDFKLISLSSNGDPCDPGTYQVGVGAFIGFNASIGGTATLKLDINNNNQFDDPVDRQLFQQIDQGSNSIFWDGKDGLGNTVSVNQSFYLNYLLTVRGGETHILLTDVENNSGGVTFNLHPSIPSPNPSVFFYDHTPIGGPVSGNGTPGHAQATTVPFTYQNGFGNDLILDYWTYFEFNGSGVGEFVIVVTEDCTGGEDHDMDGIPDIVDIDDDNDGVPDKKEFCNPDGGFGCLPGGLDPSHDEDTDGVLNFRDANDPMVNNPCTDVDGDGICDKIESIYDTDRDGVPDHLDLDSDNDGITDLVEAGHHQPDADGNGVIDGPPIDFGQNGLFNAIASDPDDLNAVETYTRWDKDVDGVPDHDDLDSDNDGIHDVAEAGYLHFDADNNGRIDDINGTLTSVGINGLVVQINPIITNLPIPLPKDTDGDGVADWHDLDSDNDLINDVEEAGNADPDNDAIIGTGIPAVNTDGKATGTASNAPDTDNDTVPDFLDLDSDNDGINDVREANGNDPDNDGWPGIGAPAVDLDGLPASDNTGTQLSTTSQPQDTDNDNVRDYRDLDSDNDGINDVAETNKSDADNDGRIGTGIPAVNSFGQASLSAPTSQPTDTDGDGIPDFRQLESDGDGIKDVTEANKPDPDFDGIIGTGTPVVNANGQATGYLTTSIPTDTDGNGLADFQQLDSDNDGIFDVEECPIATPCRDWDNDGIWDFQDPDRDGDGISDSYECETGMPCPDTDGDGLFDVDDDDTDGDGLYDEDECPNGEPCPDPNGNGIPEWREYYCAPGTALPQVVAVNGAGSFCEGMSTVLTASNVVDIDGDVVNYTWVGPNGFSFTGVAPEAGPFTVALPSLTQVNEGEYTLYLTTAAGCPGDPVSVDVTVDNVPLTPALAVTEDHLCPGETLELNSSIYSGNNITYLWFFNNGSSTSLVGTTDIPTLFIPNINLDNTGVYTVQVSAGACSSLQSNAQDVTVDNILGQTPTLTANNTVLCDGQSIELNSSIFNGNNVLYSWWFNNGSGPVFLETTNLPTYFIQNANATNSGIYTVTVSVNNCVSQYSNAQDITVVSDLGGLAPTITASQDVVCEGQTIQLNSTMIPGTNLAYNWYFNDGSSNVLIGTTSNPSYFIQNATAANSGIYSVTAFNGNCLTQFSNSQPVLVNNDLSDVVPALSINQDVLCDGQTLELNSTIVSGGNITYQWWFNDGSGIVSLGTTNIPTFYINGVTPANSGIYTVTVAMGLCESQPSNAQDVLIADDFSTLTPALSVNQDYLCDGQTIELNSTIFSGGPVTYNWWFDNGNGPVLLGNTNIPTFFIPNANTSNTGIYLVTASIGSCTSQFSNAQDIVVTQDLTGFTPALIVVDDVLCPGETLELNSSVVTGGNVVYSWWFNDGSGLESIGTTTVPTFFINDVGDANAGVYSVTFSVGNCTSQFSNEQNVTINDALGQAPTLSMNQSVICEGGTLELNSSIYPGTNVTYQWWFDDGTGPVALANTNIPTYFIANAAENNSGIYTVTVQTGGCVSQFSNAQNAVVQPAPSLTATNSTDAGAVACAGDLVQFNLPTIVGASYQWLGPAGFTSTLPSPAIESVQPANAGEYYALVTTQGCTFTSSLTSVFVYENVRAENDSFELQKNENLETVDLVANDFLGNVLDWNIRILTNPQHGTITNKDGFITYIPQPGYTGLDGFTYEICNKDCPGLCSEATVSIRIRGEKEIEDCFVPNIITPNGDGTNDAFFVNCLEDQFPNNSIKIFNRWGDLVYQSEPYKNDWKGTYKGDPLPPGTYFYILQLDVKVNELLQGYFTITR
ncbi:MAG: PKD domain-containing protein [Saprospiraceae bacterium]